MKNSNRIDLSLSGAALFVSALAGIAALFLDPYSVLLSILATLIMTGPTVFVSHMVVSRYRSRKENLHNTILLHVCLEEFKVTMTLVERVISILYKGQSADTSSITNLPDPSIPHDHPLNSLLSSLDTLSKRYDVATRFSTLERTDEIPWIAKGDLLTFPDFPLVSKSLDSMMPADDLPWSRYMAHFAARWYETVPFRLTIFTHGSAISDIKVGIPDAMAYAHLQITAGSGYAVVEPSNYLNHVGEALRMTRLILKYLVDELKLPPDHIRLIVREHLAE